MDHSVHKGRIAEHASHTLVVLIECRRILARAAFHADPKAGKRILEFFIARNNNDHTRMDYLKR